MFQLISKIIIHTFYSTENLFVRIYYTIGEIYYVIVISFFLYIITLILLAFFKLCQWFVIADLVLTNMAAWCNSVSGDSISILIFNIIQAKSPDSGSTIRTNNLSVYRNNILPPTNTETNKAKQFLLYFLHIGYSFFWSFFSFPNGNTISLRKICSKAVANNHQAIKCDKCNLRIHIKCNKINKQTYNYLKSDSSHWFCISCTKESLPFSGIEDGEFTHATLGKTSNFFIKLPHWLSNTGYIFQSQD